MIGRIYFAVNIEEELITDMEPNSLLISYYPTNINFKQKKINTLDENFIKKILKKKINLISLHVAMDICKEHSPAGAIAKKIKIDDIEISFEYKELGEVGIIGTITDLKSLSNYLKIKIDFIKDMEFKKIGIVAGAGGLKNFVQEAKEKKCLGYITGEIVDESIYLEDIKIFNIGHFHSIATGMELLSEYYKKHFKIPCYFLTSYNYNDSKI